MCAVNYKPVYSVVKQGQHTFWNMYAESASCQNKFVFRPSGTIFLNGVTGDLRGWSQLKPEVGCSHLLCHFFVIIK